MENGESSRPMINEPPPFKGPNIRFPIIIPIKGRGFINQGSTLGLQGDSAKVLCEFYGQSKNWKPKSQA